MPRCQRSSHRTHPNPNSDPNPYSNPTLTLTLTLNVPAGTYNPNERATSIEACMVCEPRTFCPEES